MSKRNKRSQGYYDHSTVQIGRFKMRRFKHLQSPGEVCYELDRGQVRIWTRRGRVPTEQEIIENIGKLER